MPDRAIVRRHGVQGDPEQARLDDPVLGERGIQIRRVEVGDPVPQRQVRRRGLLRLQPDQPPDGVDHVERLTLQQQLPSQGGPVELPAGELHPLIMQPMTDTGSDRALLAA